MPAPVSLSGVGLLAVVGLLAASQALLARPAAQIRGGYDAIHSGTPWFDQRGMPVSAHGAGIIKDGETYYLFGEAHQDLTNAFAGFNCYSSKDLANWRFERVALPVQQAGPLGPQTVGERPKVMRSPKTGEYVMFMHVDALDYRSQFVGYATADTVTGPYTFRGPLLFQGAPIRKWDMGTFQDADGSGYVLLHGGDIYRLNDDFRSVRAHVNKAMAHGFESPAMFRKDDIYFFLGSHLTGWERNDNYYFTARSLAGPWTRHGSIAPEGTLTWNSQVTFVLPIKGLRETTYMLMGDRWSYPHQATAASYVWQPLIVTGTAVSMTPYRSAWRLDMVQGIVAPELATGVTITATDPRVRLAGLWRQSAVGQPAEYITNEKAASVSVRFVGTRASMYSVARPDGGYARITLRDGKGRRVLSAIVDMYSKYAVSSAIFVTPRLPRGSYTLDATALGSGWYWVSKKGEKSGSSGSAISFKQLNVRE